MTWLYEDPRHRIEALNGTDVAEVTTDAFGVPRNSPPCQGALEFVGP